MILVTGGTGLVGSHLLIQLSQRPEPIRAIYRNAKRIEQVKKLFQFYGDQDLQQFDKIEWFACDVLDIVDLDAAFKEVTYVYHCAALVSFYRRDFQKLIKINREGTANIVNLSLEYGIKKLAYVSSTAAIGGVENTIVTEETKWKQSPRTSGYSISKYSAEKEVWRGVEEGLDAVIVNPSVIFGAGNWNDSSLTIFRTVNKGLKFYTSGQNGFVDARDVSKAMIQLMDSQIKNERFLCVSENLPFKDMLQLMARTMHVKEPSMNTPRWLANFGWRVIATISVLLGKRPAITKETTASAFSFMTYSNTKIKERLNFEFISVEDSIKNAIKGKIN